MSEGSGRVPLEYMRVAESIAAKISSGELLPGDRLRSEPDLADEYQVSYGTIRRAMKELRGRGLIQTAWGKGNIVCG
jgi:DNA-binding GntR family transcriptional regulator